MDFNTLLKSMVEQDASDLFITVGLPPTIKKQEALLPLSKDPLTEIDAQNLLFGIMTSMQKAEFEHKKELNFAIQDKTLGRFRVSVFQQRLQIGAVLRHIKSQIPTLKELHMPTILEKLVLDKQGLILVVGATGVGKSSTLAAMIEYRNQTLPGHIITIEDPIEFVYEYKKNIITQREVGIDTDSFSDALRNTLRQAPDVILIGEVRSLDTMNYAIAFSETGHLCLTTLHASNAYQALDRIASFFPKEARDQLWLDLSLNLKAIIAQRLIPSDSGNRVPAVEVLINTPTIADHIRKGDITGIRQFMTKTNEFGMQSFDQSLFKLYSEGEITEDSALRFADSANEIRLMIKLQKGQGVYKDTQTLSILGNDDDE